MGIADWIVVVFLCLVSLGVGLYFTKKAVKQDAAGYFTGNRNLPWWAIGLSNTATCQSGNSGIAGGPSALRTGMPAASGHLPNDDSIF